MQWVQAGKIQTRTCPNCTRSNPLAVIWQTIADGNRFAFTTSPRLQQVSLSSAIVYPDISIMNCSLNQLHRYIRSYYVQMYAGTGAIAGSLSGSGRLDYICDYPILRLLFYYRPGD